MSRPFCSHLEMLQDRASSGIFYCKQTSVAACRFQNECNKVEIALCVVQFWSEIKLVITNQFCNHAFHFRPNCAPLSAIVINKCSYLGVVILRSPELGKKPVTCPLKHIVILSNAILIHYRLFKLTI